MSIQVNQVKGDLVELVFNPREEDLRVGETLRIEERDTGEGLVVQIIAFRMVTYPSLIQEQLQLAVGQAPGLSAEILTYLSEAKASLEDLEANEVRNLKIAISKIRKLTGQRWDQWDGWIPTRDVDVTRVSDRELFDNSVADLGNPLHIGETLRGRAFHIEGHYLEKINIVTGVKGAGKSHLSKVLLLELINAGAPCVVFDLNREYIHLPKHEIDSPSGDVSHKGILHLKAGTNLKLGVRQFGLNPLVTMLTKFGLPDVSAMHFENRMSRLLEEATYHEQQGRKAPFIGIQHLLDMADDLEFSPNEVVSAAIRSRLEAARNTGVFAETPDEATSMQLEYDKISQGGALVIDISSLTNLSRQGFVQAIIDILRELCEREIQRGTGRFPFVFFEEAHLYISRNTIGYIVTRSRHLGMTCFFVTNMVGGLDETVLRQVDNLFLLHLPFDDDVRHISKSAIVDQETMASYVKRLRRHHALVLGDVTRQYPVIIKVKELKGIRTAGETQFFFKPKTASTPLDHPVPSPDKAVPEISEPEPVPRVAQQPELPMAAERQPTPQEEKLLTRLQALWPDIIANIREKSAFLGSVLVASRPSKLLDQTLTISFTARDGFQRDMLEDPEYRELLEKELSTMLRQEVTVICQTSDAGGHSRRS
jgi:DNA helicase HerA-like ATPase